MVSLMQRRREMMKLAAVGPAPLIPAEYQQVEWLASTATATGGPFYVTGYRPPTEGELVLECDFMATSYYNTSGSFYPISVNQSGANTVGVGIYTPGATASRKNIGIYNGASVLVDTGVPTQVDARRFVRATFDDDGYEKLEIDNQLSADGTTPSESLRIRGGSLCLFGVRKSNTSTQIVQFFRGRIYRAKAYLDGVLVVDMVPCYRKSDNTPGFYERVSGTFRTKSGSSTATITVGPDVT